MYITRTALIYLVTRATNLCPRRFRGRIQKYSALRPFLTRNLVKKTPRGQFNWTYLLARYVVAVRRSSQRWRTRGGSRVVLSGCSSRASVLTFRSRAILLSVLMLWKLKTLMMRSAVGANLRTRPTVSDPRGS